MENPYPDLHWRLRNNDLCYDNDDMQDAKHDAWEEGHIAGVNDRKAWEQESCTEHSYCNVQQHADGSRSYYAPRDGFGYFKHRHLCPVCMEVR